MVSELIDIVQSLTNIMAHESSTLQSPGRHPELAEMAAAKMRLVAAFDKKTVDLGRRASGWKDKLEDNERATLVGVLDDLRKCAHDNAIILERHIDLTTDMMAVVAVEAQRLAGTRSATYSASGSLFRTDMATPISVNTNL